MTPRQAAKIIGCSPSQVRTLVRTGTLRARRKLMPKPYKGFYYEIEPKEARRYAKTRPGGWPRGQPRN